MSQARRLTSVVFAKPSPYPELVGCTWPMLCPPPISVTVEIDIEQGEKYMT